MSQGSNDHQLDKCCEGVNSNSLRHQQSCYDLILTLLKKLLEDSIVGTNLNQLEEVLLVSAPTVGSKTTYLEYTGLLMEYCCKTRIDRAQSTTESMQGLV